MNTTEIIPDVLFRLQNIMGNGIYSSSIAWKIEKELDIDLCGTKPNHPAPGEDSALVKNAFAGTFSQAGQRFCFEDRSYIFGFSSISQLKSWFYSNEMFQIMEREGIQLVKMQGQVVHGNSQAIIKKDSATILETIELHNLLD